MTYVCVKEETRKNRFTQKRKIIVHRVLHQGVHNVAKVGIREVNDMYTGCV